MIALRKAFYILLFGCFALELIAFVGIHVSYSSNLPTRMDETSGHIYQMVVNHGFVVYGTDTEFRAFRWVENLQPFAIACALVAVIIGLRYGDFKMAPGRKLNE
jgi:type IV secretory pathway TraG/TraD family ATPase VirD4